MYKVTVAEKHGPTDPALMNENDKFTFSPTDVPKLEGKPFVCFTKLHVYWRPEPKWQPKQSLSI